MTTTGNAIWSKVRPNGTRAEIARVGEESWFNLVVKIDGKQVARGDLHPINRANATHKNAPAGASHLIGCFCLFPEDGAEVAAIVDQLKSEAAAATAARVAESGNRRDRVREAMIARCEARGIGRDEATAVLSRYRWEDASPQAAFDRQDMEGFRVLTIARAAGHAGADATPATKDDE